jgi:hypothetical protein
MRYRVSLIIALIFCLSAAPSFAYRGNDVDIEVISDGGYEFHTIPHKERYSGKTHIIKRYLEARRSEHYSIRISNNTPERIGLVIAVDGRNIISGKKSYLKRNESMYVLEPYDHAEYGGWRTARDTVNRFYFTDERDSYSARTFGDYSAMGVIAAVVFHEKERPRILHKNLPGEKSRAPSGAAPDSMESGRRKSDSAGTGFGGQRYSPTIRIKFKPERIPFKKILVKYEWRETLCEKGIIRCRPVERNRFWDDDEYAPYPPGHSGRPYIWEDFSEAPVRWKFSGSVSKAEWIHSFLEAFMRSSGMLVRGKEWKR